MRPFHKLLAFITLTSILVSSCKENKIEVLSFHENGLVKEQLIKGLDSIPKEYVLKQIFNKNGGLKCQGTKLNNLRDGKWKCYSEDGKLEWTATYKKGYENGLTECYYPNSTWKKSNLLEGILQGSSEEYNFDSLENRYFFVRGLYKNNLEEGVWTSKYEDETPRSETTYRNGLKHGNFKQFHKNGTTSVIGKFQNDKLQDTLLVFNNESTLVRIEIYDKGKMIKETIMR